MDTIINIKQNVIKPLLYITLMAIPLSVNAKKANYITNDIKQGDAKLEVRKLKEAKGHFEIARDSAQPTGNDNYYKKSKYRLKAAANSRLAFTKLHQGDTQQAGQLYLSTINQLRADYEAHYEKVKYQEAAKQKTQKIAFGILKKVLNDELSQVKGKINQTDKYKLLPTTDVFKHINGSIDTILRVPPPEVLVSSSQLRGDVEQHQIRIPVIPDSDYFQYIGRVTDKRTSSCTGAFVGPNLVLTNSHCIFSGGVDYGKGATKLKKGDFYFRTEWLYDQREYKVSTFYTHQGERGGWSGRVKDDWAILKVEPNKKNKLPKKYLSALPDLTQTSQNNIFTNSKAAQVFIAGYSGDLNSGAYLTMDWGCALDRAEFGQTIVNHNCSTYKGSSGAPVIHLDAELKPTVVALNVGRKFGSSDKYTGLVVPPVNWHPKLNELLNQ